MRRVRQRWCAVALAGAVALVAGCGEERYIQVAGPDGPPSDGAREPCADRNPLKSVYFGDLHVHTGYSFDAQSFDVRLPPPQAYRFAQGDAIALPPLDANGNGTQMLRLSRPLDFTAVTDHAEFLGEVEMCTTPGSAEYDSNTCQTYRQGGNVGTGLFGITLTRLPRRTPVCGANGEACLDLAGEVWRRIQEAADAAYDRSSRCSFTSFVAYEYSGSPLVSNRHRNVIFRNDRVPFPTSYMDEPTAQGLWAQLKATCLDAGTGCDVLAIPHNSNESNGGMFRVEYPGAATVEEQRAQAELRAAVEPLVEIYQHKGDSECMNGLSGVIGAPDEACNFEKRRSGDFEDCGDATGAGGVSGAGCVSRLDYVRNVLLAGLGEAERIGVNPYRLGVVASTDTHNASPGATEETAFIGHRGSDDDSVSLRLGYGSLTDGGVIFNPGGLAAVWAEENSRESLFDALRRREVFGTSGTRIAVRFFGGWELPDGLCRDPNMLESAYAAGVPMGGLLPAPADTAAPRFLVSALRDPGTETRDGTPLQRVQIIKGWLQDGELHYRVFDVAGDPDNGATVHLDTCMPQGAGADSLCTVWADPDFEPGQHAFYYARVLENPTCRWSTLTCNSLPPDERPAGCSDPAIPKTIQERAWTSPIWYDPRV